MDADGVLAIRPALTQYLHEFDDCMGKRSNRAHLATYVAGQLGDGDRKSIEPIADRAGVAPRTLQEFFGIFQWDHVRLIDRHQRRFVRRHGGLIALGYIDETSYPKKGHETAGVQRQHCGALGKVENCVVSVHLGVATEDYHIARRIPWAMYTVMDATTGPMVWEIKCVPVWIKDEDGAPTTRPWMLMLARSVNQREEIKYFLSNAAEGVPTEEIVFAAFSRWRIERLFEDAKTDLGMDHFEVRKYTSVVRHLAISCLSHAFLAEVKQRALPKSTGPDDQP